MAHGSVSRVNIISSNELTKNKSEIDVLEKIDTKKLSRQEMIDIVKSEVEAIGRQELKEQKNMLNEQLSPMLIDLKNKNNRDNEYANNLALKAAYRAEKRRDMNLTFTEFLDQLEIDLESL